MTPNETLAVARPPLRSSPTIPVEIGEEHLRGAVAVTNVTPGLPTWAQGIAAAVLVALVGVVWTTTTGRLAALEDRAARAETRATAVETEGARRGAQLDAITVSLARVDAHLDRIEAHLEGIITTGATAPRKDH